jgi:predicted RNA-binding protein YlqC (UPF0109 family)
MAGPLATLVETIAKALVDTPDAVRVSETVHRGTTLVELTVATGDTGKVIGRQGRIAEALRALVAAAAHHHGTRAALEIRDPDR